MTGFLAVAYDTWYLKRHAVEIATALRSKHTTLKANYLAAQLRHLISSADASAEAGTVRSGMRLDKHLGILTVCVKYGRNQASRCYYLYRFNTSTDGGLTICWQIWPDIDLFNPDRFCDPDDHPWTLVFDGSRFLIGREELERLIEKMDLLDSSLRKLLEAH